jgi:thioredoxin
MSNLQSLTDANWDAEVMSSEQPVLIDFWAEWCQPCKVLTPIVEAVAEQYKGRMKFGQMNVEDNDNVPFRYNITTLPTLLIIKKGQVSEQSVGLVSKDKLIKLIDPILS